MYFRYQFEGFWYLLHLQDIRLGTINYYTLHTGWQSYHDTLLGSRITSLHITGCAIVQTLSRETVRHVGFGRRSLHNAVWSISLLRYQPRSAVQQNSSCQLQHTTVSNKWKKPNPVTLFSKFLLLNLIVLMSTLSRNSRYKYC